MRMHGCLRRSQHVALRRLKAAVSAVNEDVMAGVQTIASRSLRQRRQSEVTGSGIARVVKDFKELASVADDIGD
jgi:methyl-accepting chemotaxis protein